MLAAAQPSPNFSYAYDSAGEITQWQQIQNGNNQNATYGYDLAGQLTSVQGGLTNLPPSYANQNYYAYDLASNRTAVQKSAKQSAKIGGTVTTGDTLTITVTDSSLSSPEAVTYTVRTGDTTTTIAANLAAAITADTNLQTTGVNATSNGTSISIKSASPNITTYAQSTSVGATETITLGTNTYAWDAENRLVQITYPGSGNNSQFNYDGVGHCVDIVETSGGTVISTKQFIWCGAKICEARNSSGAVLNQYLPLGETVGGVSYYCTRVHLGSIREVTNSSGNIQAQYAYDSYGQSTKLQGGLGSDIQYAGYYFHAPSGLNLAVHRAYTSKFGRWINRDPIKERGGLNLFTYVFNKPIRFSDPSGLDGSTPCLKTGAQDNNTDTGSHIPTEVGPAPQQYDLGPDPRVYTPGQTGNGGGQADGTGAGTGTGTGTHGVQPGIIDNAPGNIDTGGHDYVGGDGNLHSPDGQILIPGYRIWK